MRGNCDSWHGWGTFLPRWSHGSCSLSGVSERCDSRRNNFCHEAEWGVARRSRAPLRDTADPRSGRSYRVRARDKRVGLSVINQFASTRRQLGNYGSPFYRELWNHSSRAVPDVRERGRRGHPWKVDRAPVLRRKVVTAERRLLGASKRREMRRSAYARTGRSG